MAVPGAHTGELHAAADDPHVAINQSQVYLLVLQGHYAHCCSDLAAGHRVARVAAHENLCDGKRRGGVGKRNALEDL